MFEIYTTWKTTAHNKVLLFWGKKAIYSQKMVAPWKSYSPKSVCWYQCFSVWKKVDGESLVHDKVFVLKKTFSAKIAIFPLKITQFKIFLWLTQAPNTVMQICRNKGATKKASRKTVYDNIFKVLAKKVIFIKNKWWYSTTKTKFKP